MHHVIRIFRQQAGQDMCTPVKNSQRPSILKWLAVVASSPGTCFTKDLLAHWWKLMKILFVLHLILMFHSCHNFAHATTAQLSWHVQNYDTMWWLFYSRNQQMLNKIWIMSSSAVGETSLRLPHNKYHCSLVDFLFIFVRKMTLNSSRP